MTARTEQHRSYTVIPPSTFRFEPLTYDDSALATNATMPAISSGRP
jgi:hypothetical protein